MNHTGKRHLWLMLLCCLIPIAALGAIFLFNISVSRVLLVGLFLLCPLLHWWLMRDGGHAHGGETSSATSPILSEDNVRTPSDPTRSP